MNTIPISRDAVEQALESLRAAKEYMRLPEYHQALRDTHDSEMFLAEAIAQADQSAMPQAQDGEPEPAYKVRPYSSVPGEKVSAPQDFYSAEQYREAIAKKDAEFMCVVHQAAEVERNALEVVTRLHAEAAELRTALRACVDALEKTKLALDAAIESAAEQNHSELEYGFEVTKTQVCAAITQAQEQLK